jgi:hypothetical protein
MGRKFLTIKQHENKHKLFMNDIKMIFRKTKKITPTIPYFQKTEKIDDKEIITDS